MKLRAKKVEILNEEVNFASPEDVIIHKILAGRQRNIEDVRTIILRNPDIDAKYICDWLNEFDAASNTKGFLKTFEEIINKFKSQ